MTTPPGAALALAVHHVSFLVDDLNAALGFYVGVLGCEEVARPDLGFPGAWLRLGGAVQVHLVTRWGDTDTGTPPGEPSGTANHVAFAVASHAEALRRLRSRGYDVREGDSGITQMFLQDPSGNVIELIEARG
jgi:glyoxylase I family protein